MAIPFSLPSDDSTLEQYRSIHQLLLDLMALLRTLLASNSGTVQQIATPNVVAANSPSPAAFNPASVVGANQYAVSLLPTPPPSPFESNATTTSAFILPDVVTSAMNNNINQNNNADFIHANLQCQQHCGVVTPMINRDDAGHDEYVNNHNHNHNHRRLARRRLSSCDLASRRNFSVGSTGQNKLRKRSKRGKLTKKKKKFVESVESLVQMTHANNCPWSTCDVHRIPKIIGCSDNDIERNTCGTECVHYKNGCCSDVTDRVCHRQHDDACCSSTVFQSHTISNDFKIPVCVYIGEELRKIVEYFRHSPKKDVTNIHSEDIVNVKGTSLISHFGRTMFTAVLLVIGWKLLKQN